MIDKEIIDKATEMTKEIPGRDVLTPLSQHDEVDLAPYPAIEYKIIEATTMDKVIRDVNNHLKNGRQTEGGIVVTSGPVTKFYQAMIRWNADAVEDNLANFIAKSEMSSQNFEAGAMGGKPTTTEDDVLDDNSDKND